MLTMLDREAKMGLSWKNVIIIRTDIISPRSNDNSNALTPHSPQSRHNRYLSVGRPSNTSTQHEYQPLEKTPFMTCRWHSNCFMQLIEREWIMGVQRPAVLCRALQHHWRWQRALLQLGNDPYLNCSKTRLIATWAAHCARGRPCYQVTHRGTTYDFDFKDLGRQEFSLTRTPGRSAPIFSSSSLHSDVIK